MIFFKKKKITIDCFTDNSSVYNHHPIEPSGTHIPDWFKNLSIENSEEFHGMMISRPSMKRCPGFLTLYKSSFTFPLWSDVQITTTDNSFNYAMALTFIDNGVQHHNKWQYGNTFDDYIHAKLVSPWFLQSKKYLEIACMPAIWHSPKHWEDFVILPGITDFKFQNSININLFLKKNREKIFVEAGTPLYNLVPLSDDNVEIKCHLVDTSEMNKIFLSNRFGTFSGDWRKIKKSMSTKEINNQESRCPFNIWKK